MRQPYRAASQAVYLPVTLPIEDRIDDAPYRIGLSPSGRMAAADQGREQRPFGIIEIAGGETGIHGKGSRIVKQPTSAAAVQSEIYSDSTTCCQQ
jgi:hypothetical protein